MSRIALLVVLIGASRINAAQEYFWQTLPVGEPATAQLVILFCKSCGSGMEVGKDIPLVAILRDTLGQADPSDHKLTAVWLLTYSPPTIAQKSLAAIPFFYWSLSDGSAKVKRRDTSPLLDLSAPEHPAATNLERQILQWTALDTIGTPIRATSREYRTNELDHERLHLEEANTYLLQAPVGDGPNELSEAERDFVMARLELRKKLLGGFVSSSKAGSLGRAADFEQERIRTRNWELLRQCAEKTGLIFEPVRLAGSTEKYGILWYPQRAIFEPTNNLDSIWKLLSIKNPYTDARLPHWTGWTKTIDTGVSARPVKLVPLGFYSLNYPRQPLLLVDFRDKRNLRRHDVTQKTINEITSGVVGLSHFANWYYFVASDVFNFVQERRGKTNNRAERLDSYSEFRVSLALDHDLPPGLHKQLLDRSNSLSSNPLESSPSNEMTAALKRYSLLSIEAAGDKSRLIKRLDNQRREELAASNEAPSRVDVDVAFHALSFGEYTHRARRDEDNMHLLAVYRKAEYNLNFLDKLVDAGTPPEVVYQPEKVRASVADLGSVLPEIGAASIRNHAKRTLDALGKISSTESLKSECRLQAQKLDERLLLPSKVPGIAAKPVAPLINELR